MQSKRKNKDLKYVMAYTTTKTKADAVKIASAIVNEGLAACVNIIPELTSVYKWKGKTVKSKEYMLIVKTGRQKMNRIEKILKILNSYEVPEFISVDITYGSKDYLAWLYGILKNQGKK